MTNDTNIKNDKDINANIAHDDHFNDSIEIGRAHV